MRTKIVLGLISSAVIVAVLAVSFFPTGPKLVWNASASAPIGLYWIASRKPGIGEFVLVSPSRDIAKLIEERRYVPRDMPLIKRVAAVEGHEICRKGAAVFISKMHVADADLVDSSDRLMPRWNGCFTLRENEVFLLNSHQKSLDGRYFGATETSDVLGVAVPVFVRKEGQ